MTSLITSFFEEEMVTVNELIDFIEDLNCTEIDGNDDTNTIDEETLIILECKHKLQQFISEYQVDISKVEEMKILD